MQCLANAQAIAEVQDQHFIALNLNGNVAVENTSKQGLAACRTDRTDLLKCNVLHKQLHKHRKVRDEHFNALN